MAKKEFKVGEVFQCGLVKLRVERIDDYRCVECYLNAFDCHGELCGLVGICNGFDREDKQNVIFVKVEE